MKKEDEFTPLEARLAQAFRAKPAVWTPECLEPDALIGILDMGIRYPDGARLLKHIATCGYCSKEFAELKSAIQLAKQERSLHGAPEALQEEPIQKKARERPWLKPGYVPLIKQWQDQIAQVLATLTNPIPRSVMMLGGTAMAGRTESGTEAPMITLVKPVTVSVMTNRPKFRWDPAEGASSYDLTIIAPDDPDDLIEVTELQQNVWIPEQPLQWGKEYQWWVSAPQLGEDAGSAIASFQVLSQEQAEEIASAVEQFGEQPLELGILYAQAGLLDAAEQEYEKVADNDLRARDLLSDLRKTRTGI